MNDHDDPIDDPAEGDVRTPEAGDLLPAEAAAAAPVVGQEGAALAHWLEQTHRDAAANRAQARELVHTLQQVRDSHEYVGKALRDEQGRNRRLTAALLVAPVLAGLLVWGVWSQFDALRSDLSDRVSEVAAGQADLQRSQDGLRLSEAADAQKTRAEALESELDRVRDDLDGVRSDHARRDETRAVESAALQVRLGELAEESAAAEGLRAQLNAMRSRTGVEAARTAELENEVRRLERELGAVQAGGGETGTGATVAPTPAGPATVPGSGAAVPPTTSPADTRTGATQPATTEAAAPNAANETEEAADPPADPDPGAGAVRRPEDLARIKRELNRLLGLSAEKVGYRVDMVGGVRGETLLDVRISGVDDNGRVIRTLQAPTATVSVRADEQDILIDLRDGFLELAGRRAPFFDGRYAIVIQSNVRPWQTSGLTCVIFE